MKTSLCSICTILLFASSAFAQDVTIAAGIQRDYAGGKRNLMEAAEKLSEADYGFKPTDEIRSFGQLFGHVANAQFGTCAAAKGEENPNQGTNNEEKTSRADIIKALSDSFAYCDSAYEALTDATASELVTFRRNQAARGYALANNIAHNSEMYGIATVYLRLKGQVPPSTERSMQRR